MATFSKVANLRRHVIEEDTLVRILRVRYSIDLLPEKKRIKANLIWKFGSRVSPRLEQDFKLLVEEGQALFDQKITEAMDAWGPIVNKTGEGSWASPLGAYKSFGEKSG